MNVYEWMLKSLGFMFYLNKKRQTLYEKNGKKVAVNKFRRREFIEVDGTEYEVKDYEHLKKLIA